MIILPCCVGKDLIRFLNYTFAFFMRLNGYQMENSVTYNS